MAQDTFYLPSQEAMLKKIYTLVNMREPVSIVSMPGLTRNYLFRSLEENNTNITIPHQKFFAKLRTKEGLEILVRDLKADVKPTLLVVGIFLDDYKEDATWFIEELQNLRAERGADFVPVIFTSVNASYKSIQKKLRVLVKSLLIMTPTERDEYTTLVSHFGSNLSMKFTSQEADVLYRLTGGHTGMTKNLLLWLSLNNVKFHGFKVSEISEVESIESWLSEIYADIPEKLVPGLATPGDADPFLERLGIIKDGKVFSELFGHYISDLKSRAEKNRPIEHLLTKQEYKIFVYLKGHLGEIVTWDTIATLIWEDKAEESYSDWAISQTIHRLREKIESTNQPYNLVTKKGIGIILMGI